MTGAWFLLPEGYVTLIQWLSPQLGNYTRPTLVMVNAILVNPLSNLTMFAIWAAAGFVGGVIAGTKKGAFVVGLVTWLSCLGILIFSLFQLLQTGLDLGSVPPLPPGSSILDVLGIPLVQSIIGELLPLISGMSGGSIDPLTLLTPIILWFVVPVITIIIAGIIGAIVRPKE